MPVLATSALQCQIRVCRFCLAEDSESGENASPGSASGDMAVVTAFAGAADFVAPCRCRGSGKFVHLGCLVKHFVVRDNWHNFHCPTCKELYEGRALQKLASISRTKMSEMYGMESPQVAQSLCYLAQSHAQLGDVKTAKFYLERCLQILERHYGVGHVATVAVLAELASAHAKLGNVTMQKDLLERSLEINERHFGTSHINTAVMLNNLATAHSELGNLSQEKALLERSLEIKEQHYGKGHVQTTAALVNLAGVYGELGDVPKARDFLQWSLDIEERHFGVGHIETAITLNNLALACGEEGDLERMRELLTKSLGIKEQHFGHDHDELCLTLANLGMVCAAMGEQTEALKHIGLARLICDRPNGLSSGRRHGVVLMRAASVEASLPLQGCGREEGALDAAQLLESSVAILKEALDPAASRRVLVLESTRMIRIWSAGGQLDVAQRLRSFLAEQGLQPPFSHSI